MIKKHKPITNIAASIKARLYAVAKRNNVQFNFVTRQYAQERFLFRLSKSKYNSFFILRGSLLFLAYNISRSRITRDIDFLGVRIGSELSEIEAIVKDISRLEYEDGVSFSHDDIRLETIKENANYSGIRVHIPYKLDTIRSMLQLDIGYGDKIVAGPITIVFPVLLNLEPPVLQVYSIETAIAEKFEAIVSLGLSSSRMKDYYDILFFASNSSFNSKIMAEALVTTFMNRGTSLDEKDHIFNQDFRENPDFQRMWKAFLEKSKLQGEAEFANVIHKMENFLLLPISNLDTGMTWDPTGFCWRKEDTK